MTRKDPDVLLLSALSAPFALLGLLLTMARVQEVLGGDLPGEPGAPAAPPEPSASPVPALLDLDVVPAELTPA